MLSMTAEEIGELYNIAPITLKKNFSRCKETLKKKYNVDLEKEGRGDKTRYFVVTEEYADPKRAVTLYQSLERNEISGPVAAGLLDIHFLAFIGIASSPSRTFRGSYRDFLKYLDLDVTDTNLQIIKKTLISLMSAKHILYVEDTTSSDHFLAGITHQSEEDMQLEIKAILLFKSFVADSRKSWIPLMKVYLALHFAEQPCTVAELVEITKLSNYKVSDALKILAEHNVLIRTKEIRKDLLTQHYYCLGSTINLNAILIED